MIERQTKSLCSFEYCRYIVTLYMQARAEDVHQEVLGGGGPGSLPQYRTERIRTFYILVTAALKPLWGIKS